MCILSQASARPSTSRAFSLSKAQSVPRALAFHTKRQLGKELPPDTPLRGSLLLKTVAQTSNLSILLDTNQSVNEYNSNSRDGHCLKFHGSHGSLPLASRTWLQPLLVSPRPGTGFMLKSHLLEPTGPCAFLVAHRAPADGLPNPTS